MLATISGLGSVDLPLWPREGARQPSACKLCALARWRSRREASSRTGADVDFFTTRSISLLQGRFLYYRVDFFTTGSISLLQGRFLYYSVDFFTAESISRLQGRFLYCRVDFVITGSICLPQGRFL